MLLQWRQVHRAIFLPVMAIALAGCGSGPTTYPVRGRVEVAGGQVEHLADSNVEAMLESDRSVRASGVVQPDGSFTLETLHAGRVIPGAIEGAYRVRIVPSEDGDKESRRRQRAAVHARFQKFDTSGLRLAVPAASDVVLQVSPR